MRGLDPRIPIARSQCPPKRDGRDKPGHDDSIGACAPARYVANFLWLTRSCLKTGFRFSESCFSLADIAREGARGNTTMTLLILIHILITVVVGAIVFWVIDKYVRDRRLANLLKILVVLVCLASILSRLLPILGVDF
jgi:hypothetical protein